MNQNLNLNIGVLSFSTEATVVPSYPERSTYAIYIDIWSTIANRLTYIALFDKAIRDFVAPVGVRTENNISHYHHLQSRHPIVIGVNAVASSL